MHVHAPEPGVLLLRRSDAACATARRMVVAEIQAELGTVPDERLVAEGLDWPWTVVQIPLSAHTGIWLVDLVVGETVASAPLVIRRATADLAPILVVARWLPGV